MKQEAYQTYAGWRLQKQSFCASHTKAGVCKSKAFAPAGVVQRSSFIDR